VRSSIPLDLSNIPAIDQFVGRTEDLKALWDILQPSASPMRKVVVLHGLGGIGKTQLAIHFARLHQKDFSVILWLNGKTKDSLLRSLADQFNKLPGVNLAAELKTEDETEQVARSVLQWLATSNNCRWLLIFDNVDKYMAKEQLEDAYYDITKIFPSADHGSIIVTT
jgi:KaiC/GvpD/RAD55 family RecA-like ATPase